MCEDQEKKLDDFYVLRDEEGADAWDYDADRTAKKKQGKKGAVKRRNVARVGWSMLEIRG